MFNKLSIPIIKHSYPRLLANQLVGVQPLSGPASLVYYLQERYGSHKSAPDDWIEVIKTWFIETFPLLTITDCTPSELQKPGEACDNFNVSNVKEGLRKAVAVVSCTDKHLQFYHTRFDYHNPNFFDLIRAEVERYFTIIPTDSDSNPCQGEEYDTSTSQNPRVVGRGLSV